ncbi:MAG: amidohydrolase family protein [Clostridiales bacterium]|jgi:imidazolonepropionase-like amidohydrolase|nr:amidohydrolase family protein [Clostridiales bacterium]
MLIKNATVYTMEDGNVLENTDILLEDGKIKEIGKNLTSGDDKVIDATGMYVTPGLIDAHIHTGGFDMKSQDLNEMTDPVTSHVDAINSIDINSRDFKELHKHGVTACCFIPGSANVICGTGFVGKTAGKSSVYELAVLNPAAMKCAMGGNPKGVYGKKGKEPMTRMGIASIFRETLRKTRDYMEKKAKAGDDKEKIPAYDAKLEALIPVLNREIPLKVHSEQFDMLTVINIAKEFGCDYTIEHGWACDLYADELVKGGGDICFGPVGIPEGYGELTGGDVALVKELDDRGLNISLITDGPIYGPQILLIQAGDAVRYGIDHYRALRMITINPARCLRVADRIGSLAPGKDADLVIWSAVPALDMSARPVCTIIDGTVQCEEAE